MTRHVPAAHQSEDHLEVVWHNARRAADDAGAPVDRRTVALLAEVALVARRLVAAADASQDPPTVDAQQLEILDELLARITGQHAGGA